MWLEIGMSYNHDIIIKWPLPLAKIIKTQTQANANAMRIKAGS
jgi:hypothetical protein